MPPALLLRLLCGCLRPTLGVGRVGVLTECEPPVALSWVHEATVLFSLHCSQTQVAHFVLQSWASQLILSPLVWAGSLGMGCQLCLGWESTPLCPLHEVVAAETGGSWSSILDLLLLLL